MTIKTRGIVLKRTNFGETDRIVTFYTSTLGKKRAKAIGARKIRARLGGHLELFMLSDLMIAKGKNLDTIISAQVIEAYPNIRTDLHKASFAYFLAELVDKIVAEELKDTRIFNLLAHTLGILNDQNFSNESLPILLIAFEMQLLNILGFSPQVSRCVHCGKTKSRKFGFSAMLGGILCENCLRYDRLATAIDLSEIKAMQGLLRLHLAKKFNFSLSFKTVELVTEKLEYFIHFVFEKNIKSLEFIKQIKKLI